MVEYGNALQSTTTDVDELIKLTGSLSLEQTKNVLARKNLNETTIQGVLASRNLTEAEVQSTTATIAKVGATTTATVATGSYTAALIANAKAMALAMLTNPVTYIVAIIAAIGFAVKKYNDWNVTIEEHKEKIKELNEEYQSLKNELDDIDKAIKDNTSRIDELVEKSNNNTITLVEEDELSKLRLENDLLQQQYETKKNLADLKRDEAIEENRATFNEEYGGAYVEPTFDNFVSEQYGTQILEYKDADNQNLILLAKENQKRLEEAMASGDKELINSLQEDKKLLDTEMNERLTGLLEYQDNLVKAMNTDGTFSNEADQQMWDAVESWKKAFYENSGRSGEWNTMHIKTAIDNASLNDVQTDLEGRLDNLTEDDISNFSGLNEVLKNSNLILKDGETPASIYLRYLKDIAASKNELDTTPVEFSFSEENKTAIDNYMSKVNTLTGYYNKLHTSEGLSSEDKAELAATYQIAENSVEGYKQAILDEIDSMETESAIINAIKNAIETCTDAKEKLMLETLLNSMTNVDNEAISAAKGFDTLSNAMSTLQSRAELLRNIHKDINKYGKIDVSGLNEILSAYPELEEKVSQYNAGLITEAELFNELKKAYSTDKQNYLNLMSTKMQYDETFYNGITEIIPDWLEQLANSYGIDFNNFKNLCELKLAAQKELVKKQLQLEAARTVMNDIIGKKTAPDDPTVRTGYSDSGAEQNGTGSIDTFIETKKQYADLLKIIDGIDELIGTGLDLNWEDYGIDLDSLVKIDWSDQALSVLQEAVDDAQTALENTDGLQAQLDAVDTLNDALGDLKSGYETAKGVYETRYTEGLSKLSNPEEIKRKIESGEEFSLDPYSPEEAEIIQELIDLYGKIKEADNKIAELGIQIDDNDIVEKSKIRQEDLESQLDTVNEKLNDSTLSTEQRNSLLEQQYNLQKGINDELRIQAEHEGDTEAIAKLDAEDKNNEYQKNSDIYDSNKEDVLRNVSKNDNEITDIQNDIDLAGHGTVEQYDKIINLQKANIGEWEKQKQVALEMREANKDNAAIYEYWDNELQNCEDNIHNMNSGIKEMQQAILALPLQDVELKLQSINKEINVLNKEFETKSELVNAAIAILDEQIDAQNVIKEDVQDEIDALEKEYELRTASLDVQKAAYELEKVKNNKTAKVFKEGVGFVFEAKVEDVRDAELNYEKAVYERKKQLLEDEIKTADKNIKSLTRQKKQWEDIVTLSEHAALINKASNYDTEFKNKVLANDLTLLENINKEYKDLYLNIDSLEESKKPYELLQEELTDISQQHSLSAIKYEEALARTMSALQQYYPELAKKYEQEGTSLEEVAKKQLEGVGVTEESSKDNLETVKGTNEEITQSYNTMLTELSSVFEQLNSMLTTFATNAALMASSVASSVAAISSAISSVGSINVDIDNVDNKNDDLKDAYTKVDNSISEMYKDIADKLNASIVQNIKPTTTTTPVTVPNTTNNKTTSISFGDINVTGVQNATDFAKAIVSSLPNAMKQELNK